MILALFLSSVDQTIVGTTLPRIVFDLGGFDRFTWATTSYTVASTTRSRTAHFIAMDGRCSAQHAESLVASSTRVRHDP
ncbi:MAG: hypothetical protein CL724_04930 [Chloroflexi bacterium]|nr:hypothetical protein [Chloroflexota bacterium]